MVDLDQLIDHVPDTCAHDRQRNDRKEGRRSEREEEREATTDSLGFTHTWLVLKYLLGCPNVRNYDGS